MNHFLDLELIKSLSFGDGYVRSKVVNFSICTFNKLFNLLYHSSAKKLDYITVQVRTVSKANTQVIFKHNWLLKYHTDGDQKILIIENEQLFNFISKFSIYIISIVYKDITYTRTVVGADQSSIGCTFTTKDGKIIIK